MKLSHGTRVSMVLILFAVTFTYANTQVEARAGPNFVHRRLLNLSENTVEQTDIPTELFVAPGNNLYQVLSAEGFQEYVYNGSWKLVNASATLSTLAGEVVGKHYFLPHKDAFGGQPTWQSLSPESLVTGAPSKNVTMSSDSIPWLLLHATATSGSTGLFADATYVQRLFTKNGLAPDACDSVNVGDRFNSPYSATYYFYKK